MYRLVQSCCVACLVSKEVVAHDEAVERAVRHDTRAQFTLLHCADWTSDVAGGVHVGGVQLGIVPQVVFIVEVQLYQLLIRLVQQLRPFEHHRESVLHEEEVDEVRHGREHSALQRLQLQRQQY